MNNIVFRLWVEASIDEAIKETKEIEYEMD